LVEIVEAPQARSGPDPAFDRFRAERGAALNSSVPDDGGRGTYVAADGARIGYVIAEQRPEILAVDGAPTSIAATQGDVIDADGQGRATIKGSNPVTIDFSDWSNPKRTP
jgi:hypothetical protein